MTSTGIGKPTRRNHLRRMTEMIPENRRRKRKRFPQLVRSAEFSARGSIKVFAHKAHAVCGQHNFVISIHVTPGNIHNSAAFNLLYDDIAGTISNTKSFLITAPQKNTMELEKNLWRLYSDLTQFILSRKPKPGIPSDTLMLTTSTMTM